MKIFLTGGTGFIGSHFIDAAYTAGIDIKALRRSIESTPKIDLLHTPQWLNKSLSEVSEDDFTGIDTLIHFAAHSANVPYDSLENCIQYNVLEPLQLFRNAYSAGVRKFIVAGTCFEYGKAGERFDFIPVDAPLEPSNTYATSKAMASLAFAQFAADNEVNVSIHRIFQVFGEGEAPNRFWPSLKKAALNGTDFSMTKGEQIRDFIHVKEVANYFVDFSLKNNDRNAKIEIFNVGTGAPQTLLEFSNFWWNKWEASGKLLIGNVPYREREVMRYVPEI